MINLCWISSRVKTTYIHVFQSSLLTQLVVFRMGTFLIFCIATLYLSNQQYSFVDQQELQYTNDQTVKAQQFNLHYERNHTKSICKYLPVIVCKLRIIHSFSSIHMILIVNVILNLFKMINKISLCALFDNHIKRIGPRTEPWGTPLKKRK